MEDAAVLLAEAAERAVAAGEPRIGADATLALADIRFNRHVLDRDGVLAETEEALRVFTSFDDKAGMARALTLRGKVELLGRRDRDGE